jgi:diaminopimelate decarboxylase
MDFEGLAREHGTPLFVYHPRRLQHNYKGVAHALSRHFPRWLIAYSMKANAHGPLLRELADLGSGFDCLSRLELEHAFQLNAPPAKVVLTGPCKTRAELELALKRGAKVNADSIEEMELAAQVRPRARIGIRTSLGKPSKLGIEPLHLLAAFKRARELGLDPSGVSGHPGTQVRELTLYEGFLKRLARAVNELGHAGLEFEYLDVGGGLPDPFELKERHLTVEHYVQAAKRALFQQVDFDFTTLVLGCGRVLVADCFEALARVHYVKTSFGRKYALLDVGTNYLNPAGLSKPRFRNLSREEPEASREHYTLAGPLPFAADTLGSYEGVLKPGDLLLIENAGAYTTEFAWKMSYGSPKIVDVTS